MDVTILLHHLSLIRSFIKMTNFSIFHHQMAQFLFIESHQLHPGQFIPLLIMFSSGEDINHLISTIFGRAITQLSFFFIFRDLSSNLLPHRQLLRYCDKFFDFLHPKESHWMMMMMLLHQRRLLQIKLNFINFTNQLDHLTISSSSS